MPSPRQIRTLTLGVIIGIAFILFYTSHIRHGAPDSRSIQDFYHKTVHGLEKGGGGGGNSNGNAAAQEGAKKKPLSKSSLSVKDKDGDGHIDEDDEVLAKEMSDRLKAAEEQAKDSANRKAPKPDPPSEVVGVGNSAAHQGKPEEAKDGEDEEDEGEAASIPRSEEDADGEVGEEAQEQDMEENDGGDVEGEDAASEDYTAVETELNTILGQSPVIIFSKTYCPYSKKAKAVLLEKYDIQPPPYVVELDEHPMGPQLQAYLGEKTGRATVPNVLVNSVSIGGGDDVRELDKNSQLAEKVLSLGHKKVSIKERFQ